jgi:hypothetical protein
MIGGIVLHIIPHHLLHALSAAAGWAIAFEEILDQAVAMPQRRGRMIYRTLQWQFGLDEDALTKIKDELLYTDPEIRDMDMTF